MSVRLLAGLVCIGCSMVIFMILHSCCLENALLAVVRL